MNQLTEQSPNQYPSVLTDIPFMTQVNSILEINDSKRFMSVLNLKMFQQMFGPMSERLLTLLEYSNPKFSAPVDPYSKVKPKDALYFCVNSEITTQVRELEYGNLKTVTSNLDTRWVEVRTYTRFLVADLIYRIATRFTDRLVITTGARSKYYQCLMMARVLKMKNYDVEATCRRVAPVSLSQHVWPVHAIDISTKKLIEMDLRGGDPAFATSGAYVDFMGSCEFQHRVGLNETYTPMNRFGFISEPWHYSPRKNKWLDIASSVLKTLIQLRIVKLDTISGEDLISGNLD